MYIICDAYKLALVSKYRAPSRSRKMFLICYQKVGKLNKKCVV
jgi:hypothetical protein